MGGFHQLHVKQRLIYKRSNCIGIKKWCIDDGIIAPGAAAQAIEEQHYYVITQRMFRYIGPIPI